MMTDTYSLLGWLTAPRDPDGALSRTISNIGLERLFQGIVHDSLCESRGRPSDLFTITYTVDGEAFIDWTLRTEDEWRIFVTGMAIRGVTSDIMRRKNDE